MISATVASLVMTDIQSMAIRKIEMEGYSLPIVVFMDTRKQVHLEDIRSKHPCIMNVEYSSEDTAQFGAFLTIVTFRNRDTEDDASRNTAVKEITQGHQPEAIGFFVMSCIKIIKKMLSEKFEFTVDGLNNDPDTSSVFHNSFFLRDKPDEDHFLITPYKTEDVPKVPGEFISVDGRVKSVITFGKPWETHPTAYETKIPNPYI